MRNSMRTKQVVHSPWLPGPPRAWVRGRGEGTAGREAWAAGCGGATWPCFGFMPLIALSGAMCVPCFVCPRPGTGGTKGGGRETQKGGGRRKEREGRQGVRGVREALFWLCQYARCGTHARARTHTHTHTQVFECSGGARRGTGAGRGAGKHTKRHLFGSISQRSCSGVSDPRRSVANTCGQAQVSLHARAQSVREEGETDAERQTRTDRQTHLDPRPERETDEGGKTGLVSRMQSSGLTKPYKSNLC